MTWRIEPLPLNGPIFDGAIGVYAEAFAEAPYLDADRGNEVRRRLKESEWSRPGYDGYVATQPNGDVAGLVYGYQGCAGQWWHDTVAGKLDRSSRHAWLRDSCELVELAVAPVMQGQGAGRALLERFIGARTEATCVLSTRSESRAVEFYGRLGFETVGEVVFNPGGAPFLIMGKRLSGEADVERGWWRLRRRT